MRISYMADTFVKKFDRKCRMVVDGDPRHFFLLVPVVGSPVLLFGRCGETAICVVRERCPRVPVV